MVWFNYIIAFRTIPDDSASDAKGGVSLILVPAKVALKLTNARTAATALHSSSPARLQLNAGVT
jgi:hypothetical protein